MKNNFNSININSYSFLVLLWFIRMALPGVKYIFIPVFIIYTIYFVFQYKGDYLKTSFFLEFLKTYTSLIVLGGFYLVGIFITRKLFGQNIKDLFELFIVILILFFYFLFIHQKQNSNTLNIIFKQIVKFIGISSVIVSAIGFVKFFFQIKGYSILIDTQLGTSLNSDKNFYALYSFLGIISFIPMLSKKQKLLKSLSGQVVIVVLMLNILFSFSYRGILILVIIIVSLSVFNILTILNRTPNMIRSLNKNTRVLLVVLLIICVSFKFLPDNVFKNHLQHYFSDYILNTSELTSGAFNIDKWEYAIEYFNKQSVIKKIFGSGFIYLESFGKEFNQSKDLIDYPHNPLISSLLYSGIIGGIFAFLFLIIAVYYGVIYFKKYTLFSLMLFVSLMFVFFSGNSLFSVPVFLFLFSLSFLIRHQEIFDLHIDYNLAKPGSKLFKEIFDYLTSTILLILLTPLLFIVSITILFSMGWPIFYKQIRVGQNGKLFRLYKFRTMKKASSETSIAAKEIERITKLGKILRKTKIDELPELINIIRGDMSFVGPRPDVPGYADVLRDEDKIILQLKPGLTGPASLKYVDEENFLKNVTNPQEYNDKVIFPDKVRINKEYMRYWNFWMDIKIIIFTALRKKLKEEYFQ